MMKVKQAVYRTTHINVTQEENITSFITPNTQTGTQTNTDLHLQENTYMFGQVFTL